MSIQTRNLGQDGQIILLTDQTETRRLQSELSRHERLSALGKMMGALAHQIRTPLSAAMLYAGHLCEGKLDTEKQQQFSEKVLSRLHNIERQIQDMLFYVKGELPLNDLISVNELQQALADEMEVPLMNSNSICHWDNQAGEAYIQCNRDALTGAMMNLINNALQAIEQKGVEQKSSMQQKANLAIHFSLQKTETGKHLLIQIIDQGPGMSPEMLAKAGDLFMTTKAQGTGLGLAVVQAVMRAHAGQFLLKSESGQGTCANLLLPIVNSELTR